MHPNQLSESHEPATRGYPQSRPSGVVTLVFTDVEGSTRLLRQLGRRYGELLAAHDEIVRAAVYERGGRVIRGEGDAFFCAFEDPAAAVEACVEAQLGLHAFDWPEGAEFRIRIGLHTGPVELGREDYIGLAVHQAARVSAAAHGGQILVSEATRLLLSERLAPEIGFRRLGVFRLKDFEEPTVIYQVGHPELPDAFPALRAVPAAAHNIPHSATVFVGRRAELRELHQLVREHRLVSVLGAGGVGKTRLASEIAAPVVSAFADGAWMVELAKLRDGHAVAAEVAAILGVRPDATRGLDTMIAESLETKQLLLILDNCEHVLDEIAPLVQRILDRCREVHVLATSREPLCLPGERRFALSPLSLPTGSRDLENSEAVTLFVDRARVVAPSFDLGRDRDAVVEICRRLDGLPLAIELAAARAAAIPPARLASRLDRRFSLLRRSHRGQLAHHETLRASIDWSHELLEGDERVLLRRLAVFTGVFGLEAAEAICGSRPLDEDDVLDLLGRLIEKSLLQAVGDRYQLLESIREFAREQVEAAGELDEIVIAHIDYYAQLVEQIAAEGEGAGQREAFDRLDAVLSNVRAAVQRALERSDPAALRIAAAIGPYGFVRNRLGEVAQWCIDAAAISSAPPDLRARALHQAGFALVVMGSPDGGQAVLDDGLELAREAGEPMLLAESLVMGADLRLEAGRDAAAQPLAAEAVELVRGLDDDVLLGRALSFLAWSERSEVGPGGTVRRLTEALAVLERSGDARQIGRVTLMLAYLFLEIEDLDRAEEHATRCRDSSISIGHPIGQAMAEIALGWVALARGQPDRAAELLGKCLTTARESGYPVLMTYCIAIGTGLAVGAGDLERAARLVGAIAAETRLDDLGGEGGREIGRRLRVIEAQVAAELGERFAPLRAQGTRTPLVQFADDLRV